MPAIDGPSTTATGTASTAPSTKPATYWMPSRPGLSPAVRGPGREVGRVSVRYVVGFAHYNAEEVGDRGEAGRLQRRRWHRNTVRSGQLPGGSGAGYHRRMVAKVKGAPCGRVDAHVRHEPGQDQLPAGC